MNSTCINFHNSYRDLMGEKNKSYNIILHYKKTRFNVTSRFGHVDVGGDVRACQRGGHFFSRVSCHTKEAYKICHTKYNIYTICHAKYTIKNTIYIQHAIQIIVYTIYHTKYNIYNMPYTYIQYIVFIKYIAWLENLHINQ